MSDSIHLEVDGDVAIIRMDDGKANALGPSVIADLTEALDRAAREAKATVLAGREGRFSAGFDLGVLRDGGAPAGKQLVGAGARLAVRVARHPTPLVLACTGHALAMGAVLLLAADVRIGAVGDFKIGFNEVTIGMITPQFLTELARERLSKRHFHRATIQAEIYSPEAAVDAGFLDDVTEAGEVVSSARTVAQRLAGLPRGAYVGTRKMAREEVLVKIEEGLAADMDRAFPTKP